MQCVLGHFCFQKECLPLGLFKWHLVLVGRPSQRGVQRPAATALLSFCTLILTPWLPAPPGPISS